MATAGARAYKRGSRDGAPRIQALVGVRAKPPEAENLFKTLSISVLKFSNLK